MRGGEGGLRPGAAWREDAPGLDGTWLPGGAPPAPALGVAVEAGNPRGGGVGPAPLPHPHPTEVWESLFAVCSGGHLGHPPTSWGSGTLLFTCPGEAVLFRAAGGQPGWPGTTWDAGYEVAGPTTPRKLGATLLAWPGVEYQARGRRCLPWHLSGYLSRQQSLADGVEWAHMCTRVCVCTHTQTPSEAHPPARPPIRASSRAGLELALLPGSGPSLVLLINFL